MTHTSKSTPVKSKIQVLGVTFDSMLNMKEAPERLQKRNNILEKIPVATGAAQETLSVTYKAIGQSVLNYDAPIWAATISNTNRNHLQSIALRAITGCVRMSKNLHNEGEMLPGEGEKLTQMLD